MANNKRLLWLLPLLLFVGMLVLFAGRIGKAKVTLPSAVIGKTQPALSLTVMGMDTAQTLAEIQQQFKLQKYRGNGSFVVNVWATWCASCRQEHAQLMHFSAKGIPMVGVVYTDTLEKVSAYLNDEGNPYLVVLDDADGKMAQEFGVYGTPESYLIAADGRIVERHVGVLTEQVWQEKFAYAFN